MLNLDNVVLNLKYHEGYKKLPYIDPLVRMKMQKQNPNELKIIEEFLPSLKLTVGYGTLLEISKSKAAAFVRLHVLDVIDELKRRKPVFARLPFEAQEIFVEMGYQMGVGGLLKFYKTWKYAEAHEFEKASVEMLDSTWYRQLHEADMLDGTDSVNRAEKLSERMARVG